MKADIPALQERLSDFGLNPQDWILEAQNKIGDLFQFKIRSQDDREVLLQGWAEHNAWVIVSYQG